MGERREREATRIGQEKPKGRKAERTGQGESRKEEARRGMKRKGTQTNQEEKGQ